MLSIERRTGESLRIGCDVEVQVLDIGRRHVQLAIRAPRGMTILRDDVASREPAGGLQRKQERRADGRPDMLILRRRAGESVTIGEGIEVGVVGIRCRHVKLGIRAAREIAVHRSAGAPGNR